MGDGVRSVGDDEGASRGAGEPVALPVPLSSGGGVGGRVLLRSSVGELAPGWLGLRRAEVSLSMKMACTNTAMQRTSSKLLYCLPWYLRSGSSMLKTVVAAALAL